MKGSYWILGQTVLIGNEFARVTQRASCREDVGVTVNRTASFDDRYQGSIIVDITTEKQELAAEWTYVFEESSYRLASFHSAYKLVCATAKVQIPQ